LFYNQPLAIRFGTELLRQIGQFGQIDPFWDKLDIAVAWVRASGMAYLSDRFAKFLSHGGQLSIIVGIDIQNTTREGLQALLDLEQHGRCETFVYHNEAGSVFHPKLYLFRNEEEARLIVGSNNVTQSGLFVNVEAGLQVDTDVDASVIEQAMDALSSWKDTSQNLAVRLDAPFLARLCHEGYVPDEARARREMQQASKALGARSVPLFGSKRYVPPFPGSRMVAPPTSRKSRAAVPYAHQPAREDRANLLPAGSDHAVREARTPSGTVLLMRLRKAHIRDRPTQAQIPFRVVDQFFHGVDTVRSSHSGDEHKIVEASARGGRNTIKLEIPEMRGFAQPVARFERRAEGIVYETYDVGTPQGNQIIASLEEGRANGATQLAVSDARRATWWRYI
jgi:HKD family nuclease